MILDAEKGGHRGLLINLDTNQPIRKARWANTNTGEFVAEKLDGNGNNVYDKTGKKVTYQGRAKLRFVPTDAKTAAAVTNPRTPRVTTVSKQPKQVNFPLFGGYCEHYGCNRIATYMVSDETPLPYQIVGRKAYARAKLVAWHYFCPWHYQAPKMLDARGEIIEVWEDAGGVRPE